MASRELPISRVIGSASLRLYVIFDATQSGPGLRFPGKSGLQAVRCRSAIGSKLRQRGSTVKDLAEITRLVNSYRTHSFCYARLMADSRTFYQYKM